jgi:hypothetical protein
LANILDPFHEEPSGNVHPIRYQTYEESNGFNSLAMIAEGEDGMWDFSLYATNKASGKTYRFRIVKSDGSALTAYSFYPEITIE